MTGTPAYPAELAGAVDPPATLAELTAEYVAEQTGADVDRADRVVAVAAELVNRYAPRAPESVRVEAALRCCGWMLQAPSDGARREDTGDISTAWSPTVTGAMLASGAKGLLSPWRRRRAGAT